MSTVDLEKFLKILEDGKTECTLCSVTYTVPCKAIDHLRKIHNSAHESWKCPYCELQFLRLDGLKKHSLYSHKVEFTDSGTMKKAVSGKLVNCFDLPYLVYLKFIYLIFLISEKSSVQQELVKQQREKISELFIVNNGKHVCSTCSASFNGEPSLMRHITGKHKSELNQFFYGNPNKSYDNVVLTCKF